MNTPALRLLDVTRIHGTGETAVHALRGVSLEIEGGELVAQTSERLRGTKGGRLRLAERELLLEQLLLDGAERGAALFERGAKLGDARFGLGKCCAHFRLDQCSNIGL